MPEVVSDTSPLHYLALLEHLDLLPQIFGSVLVPGAVVTELDEGRRLGISLPDLRELPWIEIRKVDSPALPALAIQLGAGEREAITLAAQSPGATLLLDDRLARRHAALLDVQVMGTVARLARAKREERIDAVAPLYDELERLGFRLAPKTRRAALKLADEA